MKENYLNPAIDWISYEWRYNRPFVVTIAVVLTLIVFLVIGLETTINTIDYIDSKFVTYVDAEFSETTMGIDSEGNTYTETDYWSELVSETWCVYSRNGHAYEYTCPSDKLNGIVCETPPVTVEHDTYDFDSYTRIRHLSHKATLNDGYTCSVNTETLQKFINRGLGVEYKVIRLYGKPLYLKEYINE